MLTASSLFPFVKKLSMLMLTVTNKLLIYLAGIAPFSFHEVMELFAFGHRGSGPHGLPARLYPGTSITLKISACQCCYERRVKPDPG